MRKKKEPLPNPVYPPIPDDWVFPDDLDLIFPTEHQSPEKWEPDPTKQLVVMDNSEAEWIKKIRDYCKANSIYPIHILDFYREHHTEEAPD